MNRYQRFAFHLALALFVAGGYLAANAVISGLEGTHSARAFGSCGTTCSGTFYGGLANTMNAAISSSDGHWPQSTANACGIMNAIALVNYDDFNSGTNPYFNTTSFPVGSTYPFGPESKVEKDNQTNGTASSDGTLGPSQWGFAHQAGYYTWPDGSKHSGNFWAAYTNISMDFGTDPRSIAYMSWKYSISNRFFHDWVYNWSYSHSNQLPEPPFSQQVQEATTGIARALEAWDEPVSAAINQGTHSVIISGIWSGNDPNQNWPAAIQGLVYRDPEGDAITSRIELDFNTWKSGNFDNPFGHYSLWSQYYGGVRDSSGRLEDPEPTVGPYTPTITGQTHWYHGFNWIQRDNNYTNGQYSPDWEYASPGAWKLTAP